MATLRVSTGISPKYVKNWTIPMAIREFIQNGLDARTEFGCDFDIKFWKETNFAEVVDRGPGLEPRHMALGISEKSDRSIGKYGEGLKLALLVFAREGRKVEVRSRGKKIIPAVELDPALQTEVLVFYVEDYASNLSGTKVYFQCSESELDQAKSYFVIFATKFSYATTKMVEKAVTDPTSGKVKLEKREEKVFEKFEWVEKDLISSPGGRIYMNGSMVGSVAKALYSYHFRESATGNIGNRDREVVDQNRLQEHVRRILARNVSLPYAKAVLEALISNTEAYEVRLGPDPYNMSRQSREVWRKAWNAVFGSEALMDTGDDYEAVNQARYRGFKMVPVSGYYWKEALANAGVKKAIDVYKAPKVTVALVARKDLTEDERRFLDLSIKLVKTHYADPGKVLVAADGRQVARKTGAAEGESAGGAWDPKDQVIYITRKELRSLKSALDVMVHETVHKVSGASDCTSHFENALAAVAVGMMVALSGEKGK